MGIDLGNVELKVFHSSDRRTKVSPNQMSADFFVFFDNWEDMFYFVNKVEMPRVNKNRSFSLEFAKKWSYLQTDDIGVLMDELEEIVSEPAKYLRWHPKYVKSDEEKQKELTEQNSEITAINVRLEGRSQHVR